MVRIDPRYKEILPDAPEISEEDIRRCREAKDFSPIVFEWYKFVCSLCAFFASSLQDSEPIRKDIKKRDYGVLIGLINRCCRLIHANIALSHEGRFGESTSILDRCIFESCVNLTWLCNSDIEEKFDMFIASGLKTEIEFNSHVQQSIDARDGVVLNIEKRLLKSFEELLFEAGFDEEKIRNTRRLPDLATRLNCLSDTRITYTIGQKIGSHYIHGTWVGLRKQYLERDESGNYHAKQACETHIYQYIWTADLVVTALAHFVDFVSVSGQDEAKIFMELFKGTAEEISKLDKEMRGTDYDEVSH